MKLRSHFIGQYITPAIFYCLLWYSPVSSETIIRATMPEKETSIVFAYSPNVFYNVDPKDVIALIDVWTNEIDRIMRNPTSTSIVAFKTLAEAEKALAGNKVDVLVMIPEEFVSLRTKYHL